MKVVRPMLRAALALSAMLSGACSHYRLGTGALPPFHSLYIEPVANRTLLPQARELVSASLREAFATDGRVSIAGSLADADATLSVAIVDYHRDVAALREGDTGLARKFNLVLGVDCSLRGRDGTTLFSGRRVDVRREAFTDGGQLQSEYQTLPLMADSLARKVMHTALDVW